MNDWFHLPKVLQNPSYFLALHTSLAARSPISITVNSKERLSGYSFVNSHKPVASLANRPLFLGSILVLGKILHHYLEQSTISSFRVG